MAFYKLVSDMKVAGLPDCEACGGFHAIFKKQYQLPNGDRYWMDVCVFCSGKNRDFEVQS
jgi:hypothetical protein